MMVSNLTVKYVKRSDNDQFNPFGFIQLSIVERRSILHAARATIYLAKG